MIAAASLMYAILQKKEEINNLSSRIEHLRRPLLKPLNVAIPTFEPPELGFLRTVAYLYVMYFEAGRLTLDCVIAASNAYGFSADSPPRRHPKHVRSLRTLLQHNVDPLARKDDEVSRICNEWFKMQCGSVLPGNEDQWRRSLVGLLDEGVSFYTFICDILRLVEKDDACAQIVIDWVRRITRSIEPHEFDGLISIAANDMGRTEIDAAILRKRHYHRWNEHIRILKDDVDLQHEARKLVEYVLLTEVSRRLPISGKDIIDSLQITPGHRVGELLQFARISYEAQPCSRDELMARVAARMKEFH